MPPGQLSNWVVAQRQLGTALKGRFDAWHSQACVAQPSIRSCLEGSGRAPAFSDGIVPPPVLPSCANVCLNVYIELKPRVDECLNVLIIGDDQRWRRRATFSRYIDGGTCLAPGRVYQSASLLHLFFSFRAARFCCAKSDTYETVYRSVRDILTRQAQPAAKLGGGIQSLSMIDGRSSHFNSIHYGNKSSRAFPGPPLIFGLVGCANLVHLQHIICACVFAALRIEICILDED